MVEDEINTQIQNKLPSAEMFFYLECTLKNPKDIWNEFTFVDNSYFDYTKVNIFSIKRVNMSLDWKRKKDVVYEML